MRIKENKTKLYVSHLGGEITFAHPNVGPETYVNVGTEISTQGLIRPSMAQTASLVYSAFRYRDSKYSQEIERILKNEWLWVFTGNRYVKSDNGVYIEDNPKIKEGKILIDNRDNLIKRLESNDNSVRFVPFGFEKGEQKLRELEKNPYVIGLAGKEGAEKLAEVAGTYKSEPLIFVLNKDDFDSEKTKVSIMGSGWGFGKRLVFGSSHGDGRIAYAFGTY